MVPARRQTIFWLSVMVFCIPVEPVMAGDGASPHASLLVFTMLPVMVLATLAAGGYKILKRMETDKGRPVSAVAKIGRALLVTIALVLTWTGSFWIFISILAFGLFALGRAAQLLQWGMKARIGRERPGYLSEARAGHLFASAAFIFVMTGLLALGALVYSGTAATVDYRERADRQALESLVKKEMAKVRLGEAIQGKGAQMDPKALQSLDTAAELASLNGIRTRAFIDYPPEGKRFIVYLLPKNAPLPFTRGRSYRADESGSIRMCKVSDKDERCPPGAPVVREIPDHSVQQMVEPLKTLTPKR